MIFPGKAAEHALLQKLAAATKIPRAEFVKDPLFSRDTREELPVFRYPILAERFSLRNLDPYFYCVTLGGKGTINLLSLTEPAKWLKCPLREAFLQGEAYVADHGVKGSYCLSTHIVGTVWITTYHPGGYATPRGDGATGGVVVYDPELGGSFFNQPARNFVVEMLGISGVGE